MTAILKVDTIQDTSGNNIINESSDTITIGASGDTIALAGTTVTGITQGITMADTWRITANKTGNSDITANWERDDTYNPGFIGTGMTESSGIFSFPSTGIYQIDFWAYLKNPGATSYAGIYLSATVDNSSYNIAAEFVTSISAADYFGGGYSSYLFDVTNTSNCKVKFTTAGANTNTIYIGNTNINYTGAQFKRLGDT
jgi:F0F1-type ATP synthase membrane subunit c/vacuolar-type H+-ATPase subunit K